MVVPYAHAGSLASTTRRFLLAPGWERRIGIIGIAAICLIAVVGPWLSPYSSTELDLRSTLESPSWAHPFGTDQFGRDVLTRVVVGAHIDLSIGFFGVTIPFVIGAFVGLLAGYHGGWFDGVTGRMIDIFTAFPFFVIVIAIVAMLGPGLRNLYFAIAIVSWVAYARIVRGQTLGVKSREYVLAARGLGYGSARIMYRHILPNAIAPAFVFAMSDFVLDILVGASLGFFGLGVQPPHAEWGVMIAEGRDFMSTAPWLVIFPGLAIAVVGFFFSLFGDGLADYVRRVEPRS